MSEKPVIHLVPWSEVVGVLSDVRINDNEVQVEIDGKLLIYPRDIHSDEVIKRYVGRRIGILKTDLPDRDLLIRVLCGEV